MYKNTNFEELQKISKKVDSKELKELLNVIEQFYKGFNKKIKVYTQKYKSTVQAILEQFPIEVRTGIDGNSLCLVGGKQVNKVDEILDALKLYIDKFKSIEYLEFLSEEKRHVVFVGPNGCGKTTLLRKLQKDTTGARIQYFSADRVLLIDDNFTPSRSYDKFIGDLQRNYEGSINYDTYNQGRYIVQQLDFFVSLLEKERTEEKEKGIQNGVTEKIIRKWNELIQERELFFEHGLCVRPIGGEKYPIKFLSSGEKSILFFLIGVLLMEEQNFYFIDEPENNLNPAIVSKLWSFLERERKNSIFVYLTHDSEFVSSRVNAKIYWIEKYDGVNWKWKELKENVDLPQELVIKLVGNREPVLFCESNDEYKYDTLLYKMMFPECKVVSAGGCDKVCALVKAYKEVGLPRNAFGIIDCDYKTDEYLKALEQNNVFHIPFHEIENFLFSEKIIKPMINKYTKEENKELVFENVKEAIKNIFISSKNQWIAKHIAFELRNKFDYRGKIISLKNLNDFKKLYADERISDKEIDELAEKYEDLYKTILSEDTYDFYLRYLDYKGLLSQEVHILKFGDEIDYQTEVMNFLNTDEGEKVLKEIRKEYFDGVEIA